MNQYNSLNVKLSNSQLNKSNFYDELLLTNTQVSNLCSWFIRLSNAFAFPGPELPTINYQLSTINFNYVSPGISG